jgi:hypothetical protein
MNKILVKELVNKGWIFKPHNFNSVYDLLIFGDYNLMADTSSWLMLDGKDGRVFDIHNPDDYEAPWTANLVMKLVDMDIRLRRNDKIENIL